MSPIARTDRKPRARVPETRRYTVLPLHRERPQGLWVIYDRVGGHRFGRYATAYSAGREAARLNLLDDVRGRGKSTEAGYMGEAWGE